jgi:hypothetical protein
LQKILSSKRSNDNDPEHLDNRKAVQKLLFGLHDLSEPILARELTPILAQNMTAELGKNDVVGYLRILEKYPKVVVREVDKVPVLDPLLASRILNVGRASEENSYATLKTLAAYSIYANEWDVLQYVRAQLYKSPAASLALASILGLEAIEELEALRVDEMKVASELLQEEAEVNREELEATIKHREDLSRQLNEFEERLRSLEQEISRPGSSDQETALRRNIEQTKMLIDHTKGLMNSTENHKQFIHTLSVRSDFEIAIKEATRLAEVKGKLRSIEPAVFRIGLQEAKEYRLKESPEISFGAWCAPDIIEAYRNAGARFGAEGDSLKVEILELAASYGTLDLRELIDIERNKSVDLPDNHPIREAFSRDPLRSLAPLLDVW